ncbi:MAG: UDP-N-acetylglucosamine 1-carboxyvinyltransferase [Elusimicrobia bacterium]|nr:UDP-N-acetylglucosamine 1-carboxyvinyltransferase [Elusimicrobiota bacterium]
MDKYVIKGGKKLHGSVTISGSKNASLPIMIASLLTDGECIIRNVPDLKDIDTVCQLLSYLGKKIKQSKNTVIIKPGTIRSLTAPYDLVKKMRASVLVMGPMLARYKKINVSLPGGCAIGIRPVQFHLNGFMEMGCTVSMNRGYVCLKTDGLKARRILLDFPSVGATENLMMGAVLAAGKTIIDNAAQEPEIVDCAQCLKKMGAKIFGEGTRTIVIQGVSQLNGVDYTVMPDRIEAGTLLIAGAITRGSITVTKAFAHHLTSLIEKLKDAGCSVSCDTDCISLRSTRALKATSIETAPYPGFPTDLQAPWIALMSVAKGVSVITESIFEKRFIHVSELGRMGARTRIQGNSVIVEGVPSLSGAPVMASDLRAGAALVVAGCAAKGTTDVLRIYHCDRGYEQFEHKLRSLGAVIRRTKA